MCPVELKYHLLGSVVKDHLETSRQGNDKLLRFAEGMASSDFAPGYVVNPVDPANFKGEVREVLEKGQVPSCVSDFRQRENMGSV